MHVTRRLLQHRKPETQFEQMYHKHFPHMYTSVHAIRKCSLHTHAVCTQVTMHSLRLHQYVCVSMCLPHSGCSPTHSSLGWPPLNPSPVQCCCLAAGLNTAHCVSAPSRPQTVPTNVLLIRWLNYSCKNNVDISLKIAVCQILLANVGLEPLLSNSPGDPPSASAPPPLPYFSSPL